MEPKKILVTYAVPQELVDIQWDENVEFLYVKTGIGKVKSAHYVTRLINNFQPDAVLNIGTAGTVKHQVGEVFCCTQFVDRDLKKVSDVLQLGTTVDMSLTLLESGVALDWPNRDAVCSTGDSFVTDDATISEDVVDMEAFAQALVCEQMEVPFVSVKCVTDVIGVNSVADWEAKLEEANKQLNTYLNERVKHFFAL